MALYASEWWKGDVGSGKGMPSHWSISAEPGTGKTASARLAQCMQGGHSLSVLSGSSSIPAVGEATSLIADTCTYIDDLVMPKSKGLDQQDAWQAWGEFFRQVYDKTRRTVCGKLRRAESVISGTANQLPCSKDAPVLSRFLISYFHALIGVHKGNVSDEMHSMHKLISACAPDFNSILFEGRVDSAAVRDCQLFLSLCASADRQPQASRHFTTHGGLLYYMLQLTVMAQAEPEDLEQVLDYVISMTQQANDNAVVSNPLPKFFVAVGKVLPGSSLGPGYDPSAGPEKICSWHNVRTKQHRVPLPFAGPHHLGVRLSALCSVIRHQLGESYCAREIQQLCEVSDMCEIGKATFFDVQKGPWPMQPAYMGPMDEETLIQNYPHYCSEFDCVFIRMQPFQLFLRNTHHVRSLVSRRQCAAVRWTEQSHILNKQSSTIINT